MTNCLLQYTEDNFKKEIKYSSILGTFFGVIPNEDTPKTMVAATTSQPYKNFLRKTGIAINKSFYLNNLRYDILNPALYYNEGSVTYNAYPNIDNAFSTYAYNPVWPEFLINNMQPNFQIEFDIYKGNEAVSESDHLSRRRVLIESIHEDCLKILNENGSQLERDVATSLKKQIDIIIDKETWIPEDKEPSVFSFSKLISFYARNKNLKPASITIANSGNFVATWFITRKHLVRIDFKANGWVNWLIFIEDAENPDKSIKEVGSNSGDDIKDKLKKFQVLSWMSRK